MRPLPPLSSLLLRNPLETAARRALACLALGVAAFGPGWIHAASPAVRASSVPNVVLILADDIGYECLSSYGAADYRTPSLDRLAARGLRFTQAHSQPVCTPSRVQIMTGQYNVRNYTRFGHLDPAQRTFGNDLREAGYATAIAGKWQLGRDRKLIDGFGFDEHCLWWLERKSWRYGNVGELIVNGEVRPGGRGEYGPDVVNDFVLDFIERHANRPFFVYYPMILPHAPFVPTPRSDGEPDLQVSDPRFFRDMVEYMDHLVGRVVSKLESLNLHENTLVIFLGDNGTNRDIVSRLVDGTTVQGGKNGTTDAGTRVPMIVSWPGTVPAGMVSEGLVDFSDVVPTLHAAAGYTPRTDRPLDGFNLLPVFKGRHPTPREWSYCWYLRDEEVHPDPTEPNLRVFARTARYKLYRDGRFFDVLNDREELRPLSAADLDPATAAIHAQLLAVIERYNLVEAKR